MTDFSEKKNSAEEVLNESFITKPIVPVVNVAENYAGNSIDPNLGISTQPSVPDPNTEINRLIGQQNFKKSSTLGYLIWSLVLPPFTTFWVMYKAWKKGVLYQLMPVMTIVYTVFFALWSLLMFSASGAFSDYLGQHVSGVPTLDKVLAILLTAAGIIFGIYFRIKGKKEGSLPLIWVGLMTALMLLQVWAGAHQLSFISGVVNKAQDTSLGL